MPFAKKKLDPDPLDAPIIPPVWWDGLDHPLSDAQFCEAFCQHVFLTTRDRDLVSLRNRAYRFIRNFLVKDLERELSAYRQVHP